MFSVNSSGQSVCRSTMASIRQYRKLLIFVSGVALFYLLVTLAELRSLPVDSLSSQQALLNSHNYGESSSITYPLEAPDRAQQDARSFTPLSNPFSNLPNAVQQVQQAQQPQPALDPVLEHPAEVVDVRTSPNTEHNDAVANNLPQVQISPNSGITPNNPNIANDAKNLQMSGASGALAAGLVSQPQPTPDEFLDQQPDLSVKPLDTDWDSLMKPVAWVNPCEFYFSSSATSASDFTTLPSVPPFCNLSLSFATRARDFIFNENYLNVTQLLEIASNQAQTSFKIVSPASPSNTNSNFLEHTINYAYQWWNEALHGVADSPGVHFKESEFVTMFPQVIGLSSSLNRSLWYSVARTISSEARALFNSEQIASGLTFWSPNINIFRDPRWGRGQETPGEDPFLNSAYAVFFVLGMQQVAISSHPKHAMYTRGARDGSANDKYLKTSACCKHFAVYNLEGINDDKRLGFDAIVSEHDLNETYLIPFKHCVTRAKVSSLMCSYNAVNGVPACANKWLMNDLARNEWKFEGYITSDCSAVTHVLDRHHHTKGLIETVNKIYEAGMDLECGDFIPHYGAIALKNIGPAARALNLYKMRTALYNAALVQFRLGMFDPPQATPWSWYSVKNQVLTKENLQLALEGARQSVVLMKNENNLLPLDITKFGSKSEKSEILTSSIGLIGPHAHYAGAMRANYFGHTRFIVTVKQGLEKITNVKEMGAPEYYVKVRMEPGCKDGVTCADMGAEELNRAVQIARESDVTVVAVGIDNNQESEFLDRLDIKLPGMQTNLVETVCAAATKCVLVVLSGGCVDISRFHGVGADFNQNVFNSDIDAVLWGGYGGMWGGRAIADVMFGMFAPVGRLTQTWYKQEYVERMDMDDMGLRPNFQTGYLGRGYRYYNGELVNFPFGFGMSFTKFECGQVTVQAANAAIEGDEAKVKVKVRNVGSMASGGNVMIYWVPGGEMDLMERPMKRLVAFEAFDVLQVGAEVELVTGLYEEFVESGEMNMQGSTIVAGGVCDA